MKKQRSASPSQAIPRSAPLERTRSTISRRFSSSSGFGSWSGNSPSGSKYISSRSRPSLRGSGRPSARPSRCRRRRRPSSAAPSAGSMKESAWARYSSQMSTSSKEPPPGAWPRPASISRLDVADPGVAGERQRPLADQLDPGVGLRVVRGGDHRAAVELARADQVVEHLGRDHAGVEHRRALEDQAVAHARPPSPARSAACRGRARPAARRAACPRSRPRTRAKARPIACAVVSSISRAVEARGCRRP